MKKTKKGFTLIEILVVVLIIGILAAIALPKYMITTRISKVKGYMTILKSLHEEEKFYFLANGTYANDITKLNINVDYNQVEELEYGNAFRSIYYTSWGRFTLYSHSSNIDSAIVFGNDEIYLSFYGPSLNQPNQTDYWLCYNSDEVCATLGGEIYIPAESHWTGKNVYYITT